MHQSKNLTLVFLECNLVYAMDDTTLIVEKNPISRIILNRPQKHNAFDEHLVAQLTQAIHELDQDDAVQVVILQANGDNFSAGGDLAWMQRMVNYSQQENINDALQLVTLLDHLNTLKKPTIALVQGKSIGGAVGLVACCDMVIASDTASFCFSEVKLGLVPATIAPYVIAKMGSSLARYYMLSAKTFSAEQALHTHLVHQVVTAEQLLSAGDELANSVLSHGPNAMQHTKQLIQHIAPIDAALLDETAAVIAKARTSDEAQRRLAAFLKKS